MARINNLTNFLTDIAEAIREKKGTSGAINASNFDEEIRNIEIGGGETNDVVGVIFEKHNDDGFPIQAKIQKLSVIGGSMFRNPSATSGFFCLLEKLTLNEQIKK